MNGLFGPTHCYPGGYTARAGVATNSLALPGSRPSWLLQQGKEPVWERTYNLLWQREALQGCPSGAGDLPFNTWCLSSDLERVCGRPPLFGVLGIRLIIGPVGGGETLADVRGGRRAAARDRAQALARYRVEFDRRGRPRAAPREPCHALGNGHATCHELVAHRGRLPATRG